MKVSGIFKTLIIIVACVILGAVVLNVLVPNVTAQVINATENMIYNATGIAFDFNADGKDGSDSSGIAETPGGKVDIGTDTVEGFK